MAIRKNSGLALFSLTSSALNIFYPFCNRFWREYLTDEMNYALFSHLGQWNFDVKLYQDVTDTIALTNYFVNTSRKALNGPRRDYFIFYPQS